MTRLSSCALLFFAVGARAQSVQLSVSTTSAELAKPVVVLAHATLPAGATLALNLARSTTETFAIDKVEGSAPDLRVEILPLAIGPLPISLSWDVTAAGKTAALGSGPLVLSVAGPAVGPTTQIEDIRPPAKARRPWWPWLLAALVVILAAWWWHKSMREELAAAPEVPIDARAPDVIALEALEALRASRLWEERRFKDFYAALTDALRQYLERRFDLPATRLTTAELCRGLKQAALDRAVLANLKSVFDRADLVKFAKFAPEESWGPAELNGAAWIVAQTTPAPAAPAAAEGAKP